MRISDWSSDVCSSDLAGQLAFVVQGMQVSQGFAHGKGKLMQVELALEHDRDDVRYALRLGTGVEHFLQTLGMMRMLLAYTFVHSPKRAAVGRQYQSAFSQAIVGSRSEEHTSELQSLMRISYAVFC